MRPRTHYQAITEEDSQQSKERQTEARISIEKENSRHQQPARRPEEGERAAFPLVPEDGFEHGPRTIVGAPLVLIVEFFHVNVVVMNCTVRRSPDEHRGWLITQ